jgi:hypothetical protein
MPAIFCVPAIRKPEQERGAEPGLIHPDISGAKNGVVYDVIPLHECLHKNIHDDRSIVTTKE